MPEGRLPEVKNNQPVQLKLPAIGAQSFNAHISRISPVIDANNGTFKVVVEVVNSDNLLKPGMFAEVEVTSRLKDEETVLIPREAVINTGDRKIAFVSLGSGKFEPRQVKTGYDAGNDMIEILEGLKIGEQIVVNGEFLCDSESRIT